MLLEEGDDLLHGDLLVALTLLRVHCGGPGKPGPYKRLLLGGGFFNGG